LYENLPSFVLGFHGCDSAVAEEIFAGRQKLRVSENKYDWLGTGVYFWEQNPRRAFEWAKEQQARSRIKIPAVVGAIIEPGYCMNLLDASFIEIVKNAYETLQLVENERGRPLPQNKPISGGSDLLLRELDCEVINTVHEHRKLQGLRPFESVRGVFVEGAPLYENAGFFAKSHIQICVRDPRCIKGYFRVMEEANSSKSRPKPGRSR